TRTGALTTFQSTAKNQRPFTFARVLPAMRVAAFRTAASPVVSSAIVRNCLSRSIGTSECILEKPGDLPDHNRHGGHGSRRDPRVSDALVLGRGDFKGADGPRDGRLAVLRP